MLILIPISEWPACAIWFVSLSVQEIEVGLVGLRNLGALAGNLFENSSFTSPGFSILISQGIG